jgi:hypothetical protein
VVVDGKGRCEEKGEDGIGWKGDEERKCIKCLLASRVKKAYLSYIHSTCRLCINYYSHTHIHTHTCRLLDDIFSPLAPDELVVGLYLYMMRLNARTLQRVEEWLREIIPCDLDPRRTIALPIRASDKCRGEYRVESGFGVSI